MSGVGTVVFYGAVMCFFAACLLMVRKGNTPESRSVLCLAQTACAGLALFIVIPNQPETDLGKYADAVSKQIGVEVVAKYKELANANVVATNDR